MMVKTKREKNVVDMVARTAFSKVNTSISIAIASQVTGSLSKYVDRYNIVLVCIVVFSCLGVFGNGLFLLKGTTLSTAKSLVGIVGTTTIMRQISDIGNELVVGSPDSTSQSPSNSGMSVSPSSPSIPSVVLGTCFVMVSGSLSQSNSREATAIRMGVQYAYSDILMAAVPDKSVRMAISMILVLIIPMTHEWVSIQKSKPGPLSAISSALILVGVSFIIDCIMPMDTDQGLLEDLARGMSAVLLIDGFTKPIPSLGDEIGPYASWIVARKFSVSLGEYGGGMLEMVAVVGVFTGMVESLRSVLKGGVVVTIRDLFVLVAAFLLAGWMVSSMNTGNPGDAAIVLVSTLFILRMVFAIMGDK